MKGLIGKKIGMSRIFSETGERIPVTVIKVDKNYIHQVKSREKDGYDAVQMGFDVVPEKKVSRPLAGHVAKHNSVPTRVIKEFKIGPDDEAIEAGQAVGVEALENVKYVDITGTSKGRGFTGTIKKYNFARGRETHGNKNHREHGSIGASAYPARVFPGQKMAGQYGSQRVTIKKLEIVKIDKEEGLVLVKGSVPGKNKGIVFLRKNTAQ
jgi:large subunit ribosomal protein L3